MDGKRSYWEMAKPYVGRAAATTLGFVAGNVSGAYGGYKGYEAFERFTKKRKMAPTNKRKRIGNTTTKYGSANKRITRSQTKQSRYRKRPTRYLEGGHEGGGIPTRYGAGVRRFKASKVRLKKKRVPKINPKFRKKVLQAVEAPKACGQYQMTYLGGWVSQNLINQDGQYVFSGAPNTLDGVWHFTVDNIVNAASWLFSNSVRVDSNVAHTPLITGRLAFNNAQLHVRNSGSKYLLTNSSMRSMNVDCYEIAPKNVGSFYYPDDTKIIKYDNTAMADAYTVATAGNNMQFESPEFHWADAFEQDYQLGSLKRTVGGDAALSTNQIYVSPTDSPTFKKQFKCSKLKSWKFEPGQEGSVYLQGPNKFTLDLNKVVIDEVYNNIQKFSRGVIFIIYYDLVAHSTSGGSRAASSDTSGGLNIERTDYFNISYHDQFVDTFNKDVKIKETQSGITAAVGTAEGFKDKQVTAL